MFICINISIFLFPNVKHKSAYKIPYKQERNYSFLKTTQETTLKNILKNKKIQNNILTSIF